MTDLVLTRDAGAIRYLTMNRPDKLNAMNADLIEQLSATLSAADADPTVAVIVLAGAGRAFSAGADLARHRPQQPPTRRAIAADLNRTMDFYRAIVRFDTPVVAAVQGYALGGGCNLAVSCDLVIAADSAIFGYPEVKLGMPAAGVAPALVQQIGRKAAFELLVLCENIDANTALGFGMINRVVPADQLMAETARIAEQLAGFDQDALWLTKQLIRRAADLPLAAAHDLGRDIGLAMHMYK